MDQRLTMGQPMEPEALDRLSPVASPDSTGLEPRSRSGGRARADSCSRNNRACDATTTRGAWKARRRDNAAASTVSSACSSSTSHPCVSHTYSEMNSTSTRLVNERYSDSRRSTSHRRMNTDSHFSLKTNSTTQRHSQTTLQCLWRARRMYMGNIKPWTLSVVLFVIAIICSHHVALSHSLPTTISRQVVEQRMRDVSTLDEYINAFRSNETTRSVFSRYFAQRSPTVNKRSYKRWGRAGKDSAIANQESAAFMAKVRYEHERASCQPRDRVVDAYEELGVPQGYVYIYPACIVVRRCEQGGCCRDDQECVPSRQTNITMNFFFDASPITREIMHDTQCECRDKPSFCPPPIMDCPDNKVWSYSECTCKCRNRCPKPFLQDETTCGCDCLSQDRTCKNIYRGRRNQKLSREECDCVRKGLCGKPPCLNGRFSMHECKCINSSS